MSQTPEGSAADGRSAFDDPLIPVLTDRIYLPALDLDIPVPGQRRTATGASGAATLTTPTARAAAADVQILGGIGGADITAAIEAAIADAMKKASGHGAAGSPGWKAPAAYAGTTAHDDGPLTEEDLGRDIEHEYATDVDTLLEADRDLAFESAPDETTADSGPAEAMEHPPPDAAKASRHEPDIAEPPAEPIAEPPAEPPAESIAAAEDSGPATPAADLTDHAAVVAADASETSLVESNSATAAVEQSGEPLTAPIAIAPLLPEARVTLLLQAVAPMATESPPADAASVTDPGQAAERAADAHAEAPAAPSPSEAAVALPPDTHTDALRDALLHGVAQRLPERVNAAMRDLMQPAIDEAIARIGEDAQVALRITMQDLVEQVLREELARRRSDPNSG